MNRDMALGYILPFSARHSNTEDYMILACAFNREASGQQYTHPQALYIEMVIGWNQEMSMPRGSLKADFRLSVWECPHSYSHSWPSIHHGGGYWQCNGTVLLGLPRLRRAQRETAEGILQASIPVSAIHWQPESCPGTNQLEWLRLPKFWLICRCSQGIWAPGGV